MDPLMLALSLVAGLATSIGFGALAGLKVGGEALGAELATYMGGLYGVTAGTLTTIVGIVVLTLLR